MQDLSTRLHYLSGGTYEGRSQITKEFIDEMLDEVIAEYGLTKGSIEIFNIIQNRLSSRIQYKIYC